MPYQFTSSASYSYTRGAKSSLFLGACPETAEEVGITTERHLITIAGPRSGKGAAFIVPNLIRWPHSVLCIDPKGENATKTWAGRRDIGQKVAVLDPFRVSNVPDDVRATFNPLDAIKPNASRSRETVEAIANGMVVVHDPRHMEWVEGARTIIAGMIAFTIATAPPEKRSLSFVRKLLLLDPALPEKGAPPNPSGLMALALAMQKCDACGGLAIDAGNTIQEALESDRGLQTAFLRGAKTATRWLDAPEIAACLESSSFDLAGLKTDSLSLYLVLRPDEIRQYSSFFRLFVKAALKLMMTDEPEQDYRCLFILDEFYSLGKVEVIAEAAGLMAGYGVTLWPFLQNIGQIKDLYGENIAETFFDSADAQIYFNANDPKTLGRISEQLERIKASELEKAPPDQTPFVEAPFPLWRWKFWQSEQTARALHELKQRNLRDEHRVKHDIKKADFDFNLSDTGRARMSPSEIAAMIGKGNDDSVARSAIIFAKAGDVLNVILWPHFSKENSAIERKRKKADLYFSKELERLEAFKYSEDSIDTIKRILNEALVQDGSFTEKGAGRIWAIARWFPLVAFIYIYSLFNGGYTETFAIASWAVYLFIVRPVVYLLIAKFIHRAEINHCKWRMDYFRKNPVFFRY